jgi:hypothetical protein
MTAASSTCLDAPRDAAHVAVMCPHCGKEAPILYRGPLAYCAACNKPRTPLSAAGVNLAGKPAQLGGTVASVFGWVVMAVTAGIALIVGAILQAIFTGAMVGWAVGGVIAALGIGAGILLLMGGRFLQRTGNQTSANVRRAALMAVAENQNGIVRTEFAAQALGVTMGEAEAFLTALSREPDSGTTLEVDNDGKLYYRFARFAPAAPWPEDARVRVEPPGPAALAQAGSTGTVLETPAEERQESVAPTKQQAR